MARRSKNKVAIVTGAGSGIGRDSALLLAAVGYSVVLVGRTKETLDAAAALIAEETRDAAGTYVFPADVTEPDAPARIVAAALDRFGRLDALVNAAGNAPLQPMEKITPALWRQTIDVNLSATVLLTVAAWPTYKQQQSGIVVNVSSMSSIDPFPGFQIYAAAKIGVNRFTKCIADEGAKQGIRAVAIAPGAVETAMLRQNFSENMIGKDKTLDPAAVAAAVRDCIIGERDFDPGETIVLASP